MVIRACECIADLMDFGLNLRPIGVLICILSICVFELDADVADGIVVVLQWSGGAILALCPESIAVAYFLADAKLHSVCSCIRRQFVACYAEFWPFGGRLFGDDAICWSGLRSAFVISLEANLPYR
ncbi:hypothetical protein Nepgr_030102 [Nepenthes gracilis]|uniref:Uncharacterized protein n=1 Tax=Nepenthes gracilis TaxID=150966 RepID=A0AAD3Y5Q9_NEPGR|nr:hypothetical protein Nepgr_030102 [Nepenthes gracilis]